jgi:hypothetical protein
MLSVADFEDEVAAHFPEFLDPFSGGILVHPVKAADGFVYEKRFLERWIADADAQGLPLVSPQQSRQPMADRSFSDDMELLRRITEAREAHERKLAANRDRPPVQVARIDALGGIFAALDELKSDRGGQQTMESWQLPTFIVLGSESAGKSTLLERVSMFPIFPRAEAICTRMAIRIELRRTDEPEPPLLSVVDMTSGRELEAPRQIPLVGGFLDVREKMDDAIKAEHSSLQGVSQTRMLVLRVCSPTVPTIDLVDLPGAPDSVLSPIPSL